MAHGVVDVKLVRWPEDGNDGAALAAQGIPVLYLVSRRDDPPRPTTCLEDWIRIPGDDSDLSARVALLQVRAANHQLPPRVDAERLEVGSDSVSLAAHEVGVVRALVDHFGAMVEDSVLIAELPASPVTPLRSVMMQLRARLRDLDLLLTRVRGRGYRLDHSTKRGLR